MQLFACGVNHHTAPVSIRERVAFGPDILPRALVDVTGERGLAREAAILSTCNRTEIYCNTQHPEGVAEWLANFHGLPPREVKPYLYQLPVMYMYTWSRGAHISSAKSGLSHRGTGLV